MGEDEANPSRGTVSYLSPFARAVLNHRPGETVEIAGQHAVVQVEHRQRSHSGTYVQNGGWGWPGGGWTGYSSFGNSRSF